MASKTVWQQTYENPNDDEQWNRFVNHYYLRVSQWAERTLKDHDAAIEVTDQVFEKLRTRIQNPNAERVEPVNDTCAGFVRIAVRFVCLDYQRHLGKRKNALIDYAKLQSPESESALDEVLRKAEEAAVLAECASTQAHLQQMKAAFTHAVNAYHSRQQTLKELGNSWAIFVDMFSVEPRHGLGAELDRKYEFKTRGYATKSANRVALALANDMNSELPDKLKFQTTNTSDDEWTRISIIFRYLLKQQESRG